MLRYVSGITKAPCIHVDEAGVEPAEHRQGHDINKSARTTGSSLSWQHGASGAPLCGPCKLRLPQQWHTVLCQHQLTCVQFLLPARLVLCEEPQEQLRTGSLTEAQYRQPAAGMISRRNCK